MLEPCPESPNCVSTQADSNDSEHFMPPLTFSSSPETVLQAAEEVLLALPRSTLLEKKDNYLHVTTASLVFRFVDDIEILIDADTQTLHFRSAAQKGHSDLGVNRKRMAAFGEAMQAKLADVTF